MSKKDERDQHLKLIQIDNNTKRLSMFADVAKVSIVGVFAYLAISAIANNNGNLGGFKIEAYLGYAWGVGATGWGYSQRRNRVAAEQKLSRLAERPGFADTVRGSPH